MPDFSPTCSEAECGVKANTVRKVLKERQKIQTMIHTINYSVVLSELLANFLPNPTFRFASCGAEIAHPFGTSTEH
ncbi:hypothetical protein Barb4_03879 [Bacteroidales bacterium Barb4]|nr:hypothetical protein Barb4_03879 [Bacteroidales bacterium Barb4]